MDIARSGVETAGVDRINRLTRGGETVLMGWKKGRRRIGFAASKPTRPNPETEARMSVGAIALGVIALGTYIGACWRKSGNWIRVNFSAASADDSVRAVSAVAVASICWRGTGEGRQGLARVFVIEGKVSAAAAAIEGSKPPWNAIVTNDVAYVKARVEC